MKIENQVCTVEQSKTLSELGVKGNSFLYWKKSCLINNTDKYIIINIEDSNINENDDYSAYSTAELGVMIPSDYFLPSNKGDKWWMSHGLTFGENEASARATMLINLIREDKCTKEEISDRLLNS